MLRLARIRARWPTAAPANGGSWSTLPLWPLSLQLARRFIYGSRNGRLLARRPRDTSQKRTALALLETSYGIKLFHSPIPFPPPSSSSVSLLLISLRRTFLRFLSRSAFACRNKCVILSLYLGFYLVPSEKENTFFFPRDDVLWLVLIQSPEIKILERALPFKFS